MDSTNVKESYGDGEPLWVISRNSPSNFFWNKINFTLLYFVLYPIGFKKTGDKSDWKYNIEW